MKVGVVSEFYYPLWGGVSEHIRAVSNALAARGHQVTVISSHMRGENGNVGPRVLRLGRSVPVRYNNSLSRFSVGWRLGEELRDLLAAEDFDVLHLHSPLQPTLTHLALKHARCPVVATFHSYYPRDLLAEAFQVPLRRRLAAARLRIPVSQAALRPVERLFPGDYRIIPNGVDYALFAEARPAALPGLDPERLRILFVGAMVKRKGLPLLLRSFARLVEARGDVDLLVVGDGPDRRRIEAALPATLAGRVHFLGAITDRARLAACYAAADVFCAPSLGRESFGMVLLEAMAAGLPCVATAAGGVREVLAGGEVGVLVPVGDPAAMASAIESLRTDPERRARLALAGRARVAGRTPERLAEDVLEVYREVAS